MRGVAGVDLTEGLARDLGAAAVAVAGPGCRVVLGRDTRESGPALEEALVEGIVSGGGVALTAGVIPTPGVAMLVGRLRGRAGLRHLGVPQPVRGQRHQVPRGRRAQAARRGRGRHRGGDGLGRRRRAAAGSSRSRTRSSATSTGWWAIYGDGLRGDRRVVFDCANGAAAAAAPLLAEKLAPRRGVHRRRARRPQHQRRGRLDPSRHARAGGAGRRRRRAGSPSTATPTAAWPSTPTAGPPTATRSSPRSRSTASATTGWRATGSSSRR